MKLIQWNIQWCRGVDGRVDPQRIVDVARALADFDVLCLQEVAVNFPALEGSLGKDQPFKLASLLPQHEPVFAAAVDHPGGQETRRRFGNMIFSRYPVQQVFRHALPWPAHSGMPSMPRAALEVVVESPLGLLRIVTTHLEFYSDVQRAAQVERLRELHAEACSHARAEPSTREKTGPFERFPRPESAILCGDFNVLLGPADPMFARLQEGIPGASRFVDGWTHAHPGKPHPPSFCVHDRTYGEPYCCDFVFVTEDLAPRLTSVAYDVDTQASDHQPVIIEME